MKFQVGDRIKCIDNTYNLFFNLIGTVIGIMKSGIGGDYIYKIKFDLRTAPAWLLGFRLNILNEETSNQEPRGGLRFI